MSDRFGVLDPLFKWDLSLDIVTSHADWGSSRIPSLFVGKTRFTSLKGIFMSRGGGTPFFGLYRYVRPQRVWFFSRFVHKLGIDFSHFAAILVINRVSIFAL